jgi:phage/plasmid-associated DNA primase
MKSNIAVILYSLPGAGKGTLIEFLCEYIFGYYNSIANTTLKDVLGHNNFHLLNKKLIAVNELETVKEEFKNNFDKLKTLITEKKITVKKLYSDLFTADCLAEYIFMTNHKYSFYIEEDDRRYFMIECSNKYKNNTDFFSKFRENVFNQTVANHFYTYLLTLLESSDDFYKLKTPETGMKKDIKKASRPVIMEYIDFLLTENDEYNKNFEVGDSEINLEDLNIYITYTDIKYKKEEYKGFKSSDLYKHYTKWCELKGERKQSDKWFKINLLEHNFQNIPKKTGNYYIYK